MYKNFELIGKGSLNHLLKEVEDNKELFGSIPLRTSYEGSAHKEVEDILLRGPLITEDSTLSELQNEVMCFSYANIHRFPKIYEACLELLFLEKGEALGRVVITKLPPQGVIYPHRDEGEAAELYSRYHIVLSGEEGNLFIIGDEEVEMRSGEIWWTNVQEEHEVINNSKYNRIHLIVDILKL